MDNVEANQGKGSKAVKGLLLVLVLCTAVAAVLYVRKGRTPSAPQTVTSVLHLETFTVNMNDPDQKAYLRLGLDLGVQRAAKSDKSAEVPVALVRDTIITILTATRPADLATPEGKQRLKEQLLQSLQQRAPGLGVHEIFFTDFLMQQ